MADIAPITDAEAERIRRAKYEREERIIERMTLCVLFIVPTITAIFLIIKKWKGW